MFLENCFYKKSVYFYFCQLTLLSISLSVNTANGSPCNSRSSLQSNSKYGDHLSNFQQKFALVRVFNILPLNF